MTGRAKKERRRAAAKLLLPWSAGRHSRQQLAERGVGAVPGGHGVGDGRGKEKRQPALGRLIGDLKKRGLQMS